MRSGADRIGSISRGFGLAAISALFTATLGVGSGMAAEGPLLPPGRVAGLTEVQARQVYKTWTERILPDIVMATELHRLGVIDPVIRIRPLAVPPGRSALMDCPDRSAPMRLLSQMAFFRNLEEPSAPMTAHVNEILALEGCPSHEVVEMDLAYRSEPAGTRMIISDYLLAVARN